MTQKKKTLVYGPTREECEKMAAEREFPRYQVFMAGINGWIHQGNDLLRAEIRSEQCLLQHHVDAWVIDTNTGNVIYQVPQKEQTPA